jgi:hypothetical protein
LQIVSDRFAADMVRCRAHHGYAHLHSPGAVQQWNDSGDSLFPEVVPGNLPDADDPLSPVIHEYIFSIFLVASPVHTINRNSRIFAGDKYNENHQSHS